MSFRSSLLRCAFLGALLFGGANFCLGQSAATPMATVKSGRERINFDADWRFAFGHATDKEQDFDFDTGYFSYLAKTGYADGPAAPHFDDRAWRHLDLPHDWAVELPFSEHASTSHGFKAVGRKFPDRSVGWYRKTFSIPATDLGRRIHITFDGVYRDAMVFVNGFFVGREASGYTGADYDLSDYLRYDSSNTVVVRVDATDEEGWFYEGAGIYRHVWLTKMAPLHLVREGTVVTTVSLGENPEIATEVSVTSESADEDFTVFETVVDAAGKTVAQSSPETHRLTAGATLAVKENLSIPGGRLWSLEEPTLYHLITSIQRQGQEVDREVTRFGIRTVRFDPNQGFFLNGQRVELKGTNDHQDHAGVGVALPDALQDFRISRLKEMGSNAYRCSHNPPTPELLDACDRLGMLVLDENRLMGSNDYHFDHLARMIRRDRNHPSVIIWSLGNEEWAIEGNVTGTRIAKTMQAFAHRLDPSRVCTVAISGGREHGISASLDVMGYNYIAQGTAEEHRAFYPNQPGMGTEETTTQGTRGVYLDDLNAAHLAPVENGSSGGNCEVGWQYYASRPYLAGLFFWTGFDYRGEPTPFGWPAISSQFGILDTCGFPKDSFYYLKAWWRKEPLVHIGTHWNWPGRDNQIVPVRVESNCEIVELWLNQNSLGRKSVPKNGHVSYDVKYTPGTLLARGFNGSNEVAKDAVETASAAALVKLSADRTELRADGADVSVVAVNVADHDGRVVPTSGNNITFQLKGPGHIIGVGNGDPSSHESDQYRDEAELRGVGDWHGKIMPGTTTTPTDEALSPIAVLGNWKAKPAVAGELYELVGTFTVEALPKDAAWTLFLPSWGKRTSVWINGHPFALNIDTTEAGPECQLSREILVKGVNRISVLVTPFADGKNHISERAHEGTLRVTHAEPAWQRKVFNGWAQVLVQTEKTGGVITLTAWAEGLESGVVELKSGVGR